jgi:hypothetical protein
MINLKLYPIVFHLSLKPPHSSAVDGPFPPPIVVSRCRDSNSAPLESKPAFECSGSFRSIFHFEFGYSPKYFHLVSSVANHSQ